MTVLYSGPAARVTNDQFEMRSPHPTSFAIKELNLVHIVIEESPLSESQRMAKSISLTLGMVALIAVTFAWPLVDSPSMVVSAVGIAVVFSAMSAGCWRTRRDEYEINAMYRGRLVCLLRTEDPRLLGQVSRALVRAMERNGYRR